MAGLITLGVDVGGTNIKLGLVDQSGKILTRTRLETKSFIRSRKRLMTALAEAISHLIKQQGFSRKNIRGIGLGLPGLIDVKKGIVTFLPNIPGWRNVPLKNFIEKKLRIPTFLDNDVNVITLAEWKYGAGRKYTNLICITLGTGVGGGLILNNALYRGEGYAAGEIGHMPLNEQGPRCNCGGFGCFERYVGNKILQKKAARIFRKKNIQFPDIYPLAKKGDRRARQFWQEAGEHIGNGLIGVVNLLNPRLIIIGGGVSNNLIFMKAKIEKVIRKRAMNVQGRMVKIVRAQLGDDAGIIGAQVLVEESYLGR